MANVCRLCLCIIPHSPYISVYKDSVSHEDKIKYILPEIDIMITPTFDLCNLCAHLLSAAYSFKCGCIKTEELIKEYISQHKDVPVNLENVKKCRNGNVLIVHEDIPEDTSDHTLEDTSEHTPEDTSDHTLEDTSEHTPDDISEHIPEHTIKIEVHDVEVKTNSEYVNVSEQLTSSFICDKCHQTFANVEMVETHRTGCMSYKCDQCEKVLFSKDEFDKHCTRHSSFKLQTCIICNKTFQRMSELRAHNLRLHSRKSIACDICKFVCLSELDFQKHKLLHRTTQKKYFCDLCTNSYSQLSHLKVHKDIHRTNKEKKCKLCDATFKNIYLLKRHRASRHRNPYVCETCGMRCTSKGILTEHIRTHTGERPFRCEICGKGFAQRGSLIVHIRCRHETARPYVCEICGKAFAVKGTFGKHMQVHTKPKEKTLPCLHGGCDRKYSTESDRRKHMQRHTSQRNHKCKLCEKTFFENGALKRHMRCHTGERPFECHTCHKRFSQRYNLQVHFKSHRPKVKKDEAMEAIKDEDVKSENND